MTPNKDFLWSAGDSLFTMRLIIEGAVDVYEENACDLVKILQSRDQLPAYIAFETIGTALYALQKRICELQALQAHEALR